MSDQQLIGPGEDGAFPSKYEPGMTYKQWLIGQALAGRMATLGNSQNPAAWRSDVIARDCVRIVEALLVEMAKTP